MTCLKPVFFVATRLCNTVRLSSQICCSLKLPCHFFGVPLQLSFVSWYKSSPSATGTAIATLLLWFSKVFALHHHGARVSVPKSFLPPWVQNLKMILFNKIIVASAISRMASIITKSIVFIYMSSYLSPPELPLKSPRLLKFLPWAKVSLSSEPPPWQSYLQNHGHQMSQKQSHFLNQ
jgi:hypothetical protein